MNNETLNLKKYLKDAEVATLLGVHRSTIRRWVNSNGDFPKPIKFSQGCTRWRIEDIKEWEKKLCLEQCQI